MTTKFTLHVNPSTMFDLVAAAQKHDTYETLCKALGERFISLVMSKGEISVMEAVGLAFYDITVVQND